MNALEIEDDLDIGLSKRESIIEYLKANNLLRYGAKISKEHVEKIIGEEASKLSEREYQFELLAIYNAIKSEFFFCTAANQHGGIRILEIEEMTAYNCQKNKNILKTIKHNMNTLSRVPMGEIAQDMQNRIDFEHSRNAKIFGAIEGTVRQKFSKSAV